MQHPNLHLLAELAEQVCTNMVPICVWCDRRIRRLPLHAAACWCLLLMVVVVVVMMMMMMMMMMMKN